ncbi:MAG TPA: hypothetical protein VFO07_11835, partial [Roseiflexaceae bacterium]|nr:hypothetical protein [Roseiflexaceae bacterium]
MSQDFQAFKPELEQQVTAALTRRSMSNRGTFPPFRIPMAAKSLVAGLIDHTDEQSAESAEALGQSLGQQGLGLAALLEAQAAVIEAIANRFSGAAEPIGFVTRYFNQLIVSFVAMEQAEVERQRAEMERVYMKTVSEQRQQQEQLR